MDNIYPLLDEADYKIQKCIEAGTITDSLSSFGLAAFKRSITLRLFNTFCISYKSTVPKLIANQSALSDKGFNAAKTNSISENYDETVAIQTNKIDLKIDISDLSSVNQIIIMACININRTVIHALQAMAKATKDNVLQKRATFKAIHKSIAPTQAQKPRKRNIKPASTILIATNIAAKNILPITLLTDVNVALCRTQHRTDTCSSGTALQYQTLWEGKKTDIPGTGEYIKLTNMSLTKKAVISKLLVIVSK